MPEPYYQDATVQLHLGDMREVVPTLGVEPDLVIADPPYQETSLQWDRWPDGWTGIVADVADSMWCFGSLRMLLERRSDFDRYWRLSQDVVWRKQNGTGFATDRFRRVHEFATHWYRGAWNLIYHQTPRVAVGIRYPDRMIAQGKRHTRHLGRIEKGAWTDDGTRQMESVIEARNLHGRGAVHPTEKPCALLRPLIEYGSPPGGLVLDPFAGSGSTAEAARQLGRRAVLVEADERYAEAIARRMSQDVLPLEVGHG